MKKFKLLLVLLVINIIIANTLKVNLLSSVISEIISSHHAFAGKVIKLNEESSQNFFGECPTSPMILPSS